MTSLTDRARAASELIDNIQSLAGLPKAIKQLQDIFDVPHLAYHATSMPNLTDRGPFIVTTYDPVWVRRYIDQDYQTLDPVVRASLRGFVPIDWRRLDFSTKQRRDFMEEAHEFDISAQGMTFPIRGPGGEHALLSINTAVDEAGWDLFVREHQGDLLLISYILHGRVRSLCAVDENLEEITLSRREVDVLYWLSRGKTFEETGLILSISARTVRAHTESARYKLNAVNTPNAIAKALSMGHIPPVSTR